MLPVPSPNRRLGRPRVLDEPKRRQVCTLVSVGFGLDGAARYVGCAPSTIRREARRNAEFREQLRCADLACELGPLNAVRQAAHTNWRAGIWYLERMNPQKFGKRNVRYITPEQLEAFMEQMVTAVMGDNQDEAACRRAIRKLETFIAQINRQSDAGRDSIPRPRRTRKRKLTPVDISKPIASVGGDSDADERHAR